MNRTMIRYLSTRLRQSLITLFLVSVVVFAGIRALPGDPALALAGEERSPQALAAIRQSYGLDDNIVVQYGRFIGHAADRRPRHLVPHRPAGRRRDRRGAPVTLELAALSLLLAVVVGIGAGVVAAVRRGRPEEWLANAVALLGLSVPTFWLGIVLVLGIRHRRPGLRRLRIRPLQRRPARQPAPHGAARRSSSAPGSRPS